MNGETRPDDETAPDPDAPTEPGTVWDEADDAMHRLLDAAFATTTPRPAHYLTPFLPGTVARPGSLVGRELAVGDTLGRFRIEGELGRGGFGVVYRATDTHLGRAVALKVPRPDRVQTVALWDRFAREARLAATLDHDAIVPVLDAGILDGVFVLVSAYQEGVPLSRWLATRHPTGMPPRLAATLALGLASGVGHAHEQGVLHRDLKPSNVLMVASPGLAGGWSPRITDFGLGTFHDEGDSATLTGFWQGSPPYMAPEQVLPSLGRVDARSDLYSLGAILYEMLTGRPIYPCASLVELSVLLGRGEPPTRPRRVRPKVPRDLETICLKCLERVPARRYPSASALHEDLQRFLEGRPILARPIPTWARLGRWARRRPSQAALVGLAITAMVVTAGLSVRHEWLLEGKNFELTRSNDQLQGTVAQRDRANDSLRSTLDRLLVSERKARRTAFAADLRLAERELAAGRVEVVQTLLLRHEPADGQEDLRDFAWDYLMARSSRIYTALPLRDFKWWRRGNPTARVWDQIESYERDSFFYPNFKLDDDGVRSAFNLRTSALERHFLGFSALDKQAARTPNLWFTDGHRRFRLEVAGLPHLLSPGGRVLVINSSGRMVGGHAPPLIDHPQLVLPVMDSTGGPDASRTVRVVEVPAESADIEFSGDGRMLACLARSSAMIQPLFYDLVSEWRAAYTEYQTMPEHTAGTRLIKTHLVLSRDGRLAVLSGDPTRIRVFETRTGRTLWCLDPEAFGTGILVTCMAFSDDLAILVAGDSGGVVRAWDATSGRPIGQFPVNVGYASTVGFHPDDRTVAIVAHDQDVIRLWTLASEPESPSLLDHGDEVWGLAFTRSGTALVSVGDNYQGIAWDLTTGAKTGTYQARDLLSALATDPTGHRVAISSFDGLVTLSRGDLAGSGKAVARALLGAKVRAVAFSPTDPGLVVAGGNVPRVLVATVGPEGEVLNERLIDIPCRDIYGLAFAPDGNTLAMGSHDRVITLWDLPGFRLRATLSARGAAVTQVAFSPDGKTLASSDTDGVIRLWDMPAGVLRSTLPRASESGGVWALAFSPDGKTLASGGDDGMVRLWDPELGVERLALLGHESKVHAVAIAPDGKTLASGDFNGVIRLWRSETSRAKPAR